MVAEEFINPSMSLALPNDYSQDIRDFEDSFSSQDSMKKGENSSRTVEIRKVGVTLAWHDLSVYVPQTSNSFWGAKTERHRPYKRLLHNVTGIVMPGSLVAVMGSSGAGKSTLMEVLAYRAKSDVVLQGQILINGVETGSFMSRVSGYVYQDDIFIDSLTVREHLAFFATMKMDRRLRGFERERRVQELLTELGLTRAENTRIGKLSGGEKKRLSFATEILTDPQILFCDEPTTGLDSFTAQKLVNIMKSMAATGKTILCTIHQPSSQVFSLFDSLILMAEGRMAYMGTTVGARKFLGSCGHECPQHFNPSDYFIKTLAISPGDESESKETVSHICNMFAVSDMAQIIEKTVCEEKQRAPTAALTISPSSKELDYDNFFGLGHQRRPFWIWKTLMLTKRALIDSYRNPGVHLIRTIQKTLLGIVVGLCFYGLMVDQEGIQGVEGALYVFINENTFPAMYAVLSLFPSEFPLFLRESKSGLYRTDSYYIAKIISLVPGFMIEPALFTTIAYWIIGLRPTFRAYLTTVVVTVLNANTASAFGCLTSAYFDSVSTANSILGPVGFIFMVIGGYYINLGSMPTYVSWIQYTSLFRYTNEALNIAQWHGISNITCNGREEPCLRSGDEVLLNRNFVAADLPFDLFGLLFLYGIFHFGAYLALILKTRKN